MKIKNFFKKSLIIISLVTGMLLMGAARSYANIYINLVAVNASSEESKEKPIKYYLPKELDPENVIDTGELELDYDLETSRYFLHGTVMLAPKESKTIKVEVKDVWRITKEEVDILKTQITDNLSMLEGTDFHMGAQIITDNMFRKLDYVLAQQDSYSDNIERRIEEYRAHVEAIEKIRKDAFSVDYLKSESSTLLEEQETVRFIVEVENPSKKESRTITQKHYLPKEVRAEHIMDSQGFDVRYDEGKGQPYLSKVEEFKSGENKRYVIEMKDIWRVPKEKVDSLRERTESIVDGMAGSEFESSANYIGRLIFERLDAIERSQQEGRRNMSKYIGAFRINQERFEKIEKDIEKIDLMLARVKSKKLEEMEKSKVKNILQKLQALRGIASLSEAIFGKKPTLTHTWRVIWGIMIFIAFFTTIHFFTWWKKAQVMGEDMAIKAGGTIQEVKAVETPEEEG